MNRQKLVTTGITSVCLGGILLLLMMPGIINEYQQGFSFDAVKRLLLCSLFLLLPMGLLYRHIKLYLYLLLTWIILTPLFIYALVLFKVKPSFELIFLLLQSNFREAAEISKDYLGWFVVMAILYILAYIILVKKLPVKQLSFQAGMLISIVSTSIIVAQCYRYLYVQKQHHSDFFSRYYPVSIVSGITDAYSIISRNNLNDARGFSFHAFKKDSLQKRQIHVFIIGETSRYDRWQINGYAKHTSPRLQQRKDLIVFSNMISGSNLTWLSVPQMITRAHPDNMDLQFKEKSILSAFKDAGFKTVWLSTQSDQQMIWQGSISLHAKTADVVNFTHTYSPNFELEDIYDDCLLPQLDSIVKADDRNLFIVLHTMGSHWDYSRRYPKRFNVFENAYDNSIVYTDFIIDSAISIIEKQNAISQVTFLSDHGEDLLDNTYHSNASAATLHVPFFIWTSTAFQQHYPNKQRALHGNQHRKTGTENIFYSLLDLANCSFPGMNYCKSVAHNNFVESDQKYYNAVARTTARYIDLVHR